jgi:hypothetical protein
MKELPIPPAAEGDDGAIELVRGWVAGGKQHASIATGIWEDAAAWGIMLVDLARLIADAYSRSEGRDPEKTLARIREGLDAEWMSPTDQPKGNFVD